MGKAQRAKGCRGERLACVYLAHRTGWTWERSGQYQTRRGGSEEPDVRCTWWSVQCDDWCLPAWYPKQDGFTLDHLHLEVKVGKQPPIRPALRQAAADCVVSGRMPVALTHVDRGGWVVSMDLDAMSDDQVRRLLLLLAEGE